MRKSLEIGVREWFGYDLRFILVDHFYSKMSDTRGKRKSQYPGRSPDERGSLATSASP